MYSLYQKQSYTYGISIVVFMSKESRLVHHVHIFIAVYRFPAYVRQFSRSDEDKSTVTHRQAAIDYELVK